MPLDPSASMSHDDLLENFKMNVYWTRGHYPLSFFDDRPSAAFGNSSWSEAPATFRESVRHMADVIRKLGHTIYVRDATCTHFYAYQVVIPGMSGVKYLSADTWKPAHHLFSRTEYICNIDRLDVSQVKQLAASMEQHVDWWHDTTRRMPLSMYAGFPVDDFDPWNETDVREILALLQYHLKEDAKAHGTLEQLIGDRQNLRLPLSGDTVVLRDLLGLALNHHFSLQEAVSTARHWHAAQTVRRLATALEQRSDILKSSMVSGWIARSENVLHKGRQYQTIEKIYLAFKRLTKEANRNQLALKDVFE